MVTPVETQTTQTRSLYLPDRGVLVELPPSCKQGVYIDPDNGKVEIDPVSGVQLKAIADNPIMKNRYPSTEDGQIYMDQVSTQWRNNLLGKAETIAGVIKQACQLIGKERFAIVLYGSLARNLARYRTHADPSNIDIVVVGDFSSQDKKQLLDLVRPVRQQITAAIKLTERCQCTTARCRCSTQKPTYGDLRFAHVDIRNTQGEVVGTDNGLVDRVGVVIQREEVIRMDGYGLTREYLSSCARPLYDEQGVWEKTENEAIAYLQLPPKTRRRIREGRDVDQSLRLIFASWQTSPRFRQDSGMIDRMVQSLRQNP